MIHKAYSLISPSFDPLKEEYIALSSIVSFFFFFLISPIRKKGAVRWMDVLECSHPPRLKPVWRYIGTLRWNTVLELFLEWCNCLLRFLLVLIQYAHGHCGRHAVPKGLYLDIALQCSTGIWSQSNPTQKYEKYFCCTECAERTWSTTYNSCAVLNTDGCK